MKVESRTIGSISHGLLVLLAVGPDDDKSTARTLAGKIAGLRIFEDVDGRMNLSVADVGGAVLSVSQFTLYGDVRRGRRPSFAGAAEPQLAERLYEAFNGEIEKAGVPCEKGLFGAHMEIALLNDGPVTLWLDSADLEKPRR